MLQNPCKTLGFKKNMVYKIPPGGEVNHIQPVAYWLCLLRPSTPFARPRLHFFKLLFRLSCNFMRIFVKTMENWWSKNLFLKSLLSVFEFV